MTSPAGLQVNPASSTDQVSVECVAALEMPEKFRCTYRVESTRLQHWDYSWAAAYFITICTKDRRCYFGEIYDKKMQLSQVGVIADMCWYEIINHTENVELGEFIVMPNHVHGILILKGGHTHTVEATHGDKQSSSNPVETTHGAKKIDGTYPVETTHGAKKIDGTYPVETTHALSLRHALSLQNDLKPGNPPPTIGQQRFQKQEKNSVSSIIGGY